MTKARIEAERQRQRIMGDSVFGIWTDTHETVRVRISPVGNSIRIRIVEVLDPSAIDVIFFFCGITTPSKRSKWTHFDLVTNLIRHPHLNEYIFGEIHLPRAHHGAGASLVMGEKSRLVLNFYDHHPGSQDVCTGSIAFQKDPEWHNRNSNRGSRAIS